MAQQPDAAWFVPQIEVIMRNKGWENGARMQSRWKAGEANALVGEAKDGQGDHHPLAIESLSIDWVLGFERARQTADELVSAAVAIAPAAQQRLIPQLNALLAQSGGSTVQLNQNPDPGPAREQAYINSRAITTGFFDGVDDLTATLGSFNMFVLPTKCTAMVTDDYRVVVQLAELGVYVRDSFDFVGDQRLGSWKLPDGLSLIEVFSDTLQAPIDDTDWVQMNNLVYRTYRDHFGMGEDFLIYTDLKLYPTALSFDYPWTS